MLPIHGAYPAISLSVNVPIVENLTVLSKVLILVDEYDTGLAWARLLSSFREFTTTESLQAYVIACRLGLEEERKIAPSYATSIHLPGLNELPEEFKHISATEYHHLTPPHSRHRREIADISSCASLTKPPPINEALCALFSGPGAQGRVRTRQTARNHFMECIREGLPLNFESPALTLRVDHRPAVI